MGFVAEKPCKVHSWDRWQSYDPILWEIGPMEYRYYRCCRIMRCMAKEKAFDLKPSGATKIVIGGRSTRRNR